MLHLFYFTTYSPPISLANYQLLKVRERVICILASLIQCQHAKGKAREAVPPFPFSLPRHLTLLSHYLSISQQKQDSLKQHV